MAYPDGNIGQQVADQLSWFHAVALRTKIGSNVNREWYAKAAIEYGWSRNVLVHQIETKAIERHGGDRSRDGDVPVSMFCGIYSSLLGCWWDSTS